MTILLYFQMDTQRQKQLGAICVRWDRSYDPWRLSPDPSLHLYGWTVAQSARELMKASCDPNKRIQRKTLKMKRIILSVIRLWKCPAEPFFCLFRLSGGRMWRWDAELIQSSSEIVASVLFDVTYAIITEYRTHNLSRAQISYGLISLILYFNIVWQCC